MTELNLEFMSLSSHFPYMEVFIMFALPQKHLQNIEGLHTLFVNK